MALPAAFENDISGCTRTAQQTFVYDYSWEQVVASYMMRFPKHALLPVLLNSEILSEEVDADTRARIIVRRCFIDVEAPGWLKKAFGVESLSFIQTTHIDPQKRFMRIMNFNEHFKDRATFGDDCCFKADATDPNKSHFEQFGFFLLPKIPFSKQIEKIMCKNYEKHSVEGRIIDVALINECISSGTWDNLTALGPDMLLKMPAEQLSASNKGSKSRSLTPMRKPSSQSVSVKTEPSIDKGLAVSKVETVATYRAPPSTSREPPGNISMESCVILGAGLFSISLFQITVLNNIFPLWSSAFLMVFLQAWFVGYHVSSYGDFWHAVVRSFHPQLTPTAAPVIREELAPVYEREESKQLTPISNFAKKTSFASTNDPFSVIADDQENDSDSSENEARAGDAHQGHEEEEAEDDDEIDEDELKEDGLEIEDDFDDSLFLQSPTDDEPDEFNFITKLRDLKVRCPAFIDKSIVSSGLVHFIVEVTLPNGTCRSVERLYTDFVRLRKYFLKNIPQCKVQLQPSFLPKKKSNQLALGNSLDQRRITLENYLSGLLLDEAVSKFGLRVLLVFLKRQGPLFPQSSFRKNISAPKKRFFGSSMAGSNSQSIELLSNPTTKVAHFLKIKWRSCLKEVRVTFDKNTGLIKMFCRLPAQKEAHCVVSADELEKICVMTAEEKVSADQDSVDSTTVPFCGDRYSFMKLVMMSGDVYYLCATKEIVTDWMSDIEAYRSNSLKKSSPNKGGATQPKHRRRTIDNIQASDTKIVLNRKKLLFVSELSKKHPCDIIHELLAIILAIFQEYTDFKCTMPAKTLKKYLKFLEQTCELQIVDLEKLLTHSERLSFFLNLYHTLVVHAHMELGLEYSHPNAKRIKTVFRVVCYDLNNQLFSLQDLEHSILRAKMSRPITLRNSFISQILTPRFNKNDTRSRWALTKPDFRINFVLNSGTKSSIYNIWIFSSNPDLLNIQLDHASTHFLNEQVIVDHGRSVVYLPRICQHYANDLGGNKAIIMKTLVKYMSVQMEREIKVMLRTEKSKLKVKYNNFDWAWRGVFFKGHDTLSEDMEGCQLKPVSNGFAAHSLPPTPNVLVEQVAS